MQQSWHTRGSQLPPQILSLVNLNYSIPILYAGIIKLELGGTLGGQLVHPPASGQAQPCVNPSCELWETSEPEDVPAVSANLFQSFFLSVTILNSW